MIAHIIEIKCRVYKTEQVSKSVNTRDGSSNWTTARISRWSVLGYILPKSLFPGMFNVHLSYYQPPLNTQLCFTVGDEEVVNLEKDQSKGFWVLSCKSTVV
ncbi:Uncharacterized protein Fot_16495 [Forsythia ovata]|uniref:Uncharacterized protein n=1 Tax=Forsythia ovata TaxID=205694 RepID=A0ABD1WCG9_9LAMI